MATTGIASHHHFPFKGLAEHPLMASECDKNESVSLIFIFPQLGSSCCKSIYAPIQANSINWQQRHSSECCTLHRLLLGSWKKCSSLLATSVLVALGACVYCYNTTFAQNVLLDSCFETLSGVLAETTFRSRLKNLMVSCHDVCNQYIYACKSFESA